MGMDCSVLLGGYKEIREAIGNEYGKEAPDLGLNSGQPAPHATCPAVSFSDAMGIWFVLVR